jgi:hypothetical protein
MPESADRSAVLVARVRLARDLRSLAGARRALVKAARQLAEIEPLQDELLERARVVARCTSALSEAVAAVKYSRDELARLSHS